MKSLRKSRSAGVLLLQYRATTNGSDGKLGLAVKMASVADTALNHHSLTGKLGTLHGIQTGFTILQVSLFLTIKSDNKVQQMSGVSILQVPRVVIIKSER